MIRYEEYLNCTICPRECGADRFVGPLGYCASGALPKVAHYGPHYWEEPPISGERGSGTVFFSGCNLRCSYCQNMDISSLPVGMATDAEHLAEIFLELGKSCHNINLVTAGHFLPTITDAIIRAKARGLHVPVVYNTSSYEKVESIRQLEGLVDIFLPDLKYMSAKLALVLSNAPGYPKVATDAICEMMRQTGHLETNNEGIAVRGVLVRHLVIPGETEDSKQVLRWIRENLGKYAHVSIMSQYTPDFIKDKESPYARRITHKEYDEVLDEAEELGLMNVLTQDLESATASYVPRYNRL